ncbi:MAG: SMP-30/gluconolactonase/LRE family protein [Candidatus Eisenbacteria sp.]|nr:SMP-30/gluconolactonase/LRE family protein [Candidatus Eisenbacteria bacterium]
MNLPRMMKRAFAFLVVSGTLFSCMASAQEGVVNFDSDRWNVVSGQVVDFMDRTCLTGVAVLKDVEFENGVIEFDMAVTTTDQRSYPGFTFRVQDMRNYERFYIRPHRAPIYPDALQYTPVINGIAGWQLYSGEGFTALAEIPANEWVHVRMEISGSRARLFFGDMDAPALTIPELKHGESKGTIGLMAEPAQLAYFSNFSYRLDDNLQFEAPPRVEPPPGIIQDWDLSQAFPMSSLDIETYPAEDFIGSLEWRSVEPEPLGLVDVARYSGRVGREADCILAKTTLHADRAEVREIMFGYSDAVSIFLNGEMLYFGNSAYRSRDPSFLGVVGWNDSIYLPLRRGDNELLLMVLEGFGGWGFQAKDGDAVFEAAGVTRHWETADQLRTPESVVYDPDRDVMYVSNYDVYNQGPASGNQYVSRVSMGGSIVEMEWAAGLKNPTGMIIHEDRLLVVERGGFVEIDLDTGEILDRHEASESQFLNDVAVDRRGRVYLSDSRKGCLWRFSDGQFEIWLDDQVADPNALLVDGSRLLWGNNRDFRLKAVDLKSKKVSVVAQLGQGIIDGLKKDREDNYLVSHWEGWIYRVTPEGEVTRILDTTTPEIKIADFEYIPKKKQVAIPTFYKNSVIMYHLNH